MNEEMKKIEADESDSNQDCSAETPNEKRQVGILRHASSRLESSDVLSSDSGEYSDPLVDDSMPIRGSEEEKSPLTSFNNNASGPRNPS